MSTLPPSVAVPQADLSRRCCRVAGLLLLVWMVPGCAAMHPLRGVPAAYLPDEFEGESRDEKRMIDPSLLVRTPPDQHRVAAGDVLSIYIPRVLGGRPTEINTVGLEPPINQPFNPGDPPTIGYPIQVRDDHTISLPEVPPIKVFNMTLHEVEQAIRKAYTVDHQILKPEEALVMVSLQRPRVYRVLVVRQEANTSLNVDSSGQMNIGSSGKGMAREVILRAYENDVMHALSRAEGGADGLPGRDAENTIYVIRRRPRQDISLLPYPHDSYCPPGQALPAQPVAPYIPGFPQSQATPAAADPVIQPVSHEVAGGPWGSYRSQAPQTVHAVHSQPASQPERRVQPVQMNAPQFDAHSMVAPPVASPQLPAYPLPAAPHSYADSGHSFSHSFSQPQMQQGGTPAVMPSAETPWVSMLQSFDPTIDNPNVIKIPIRLGPGEVANVTEDQITLYDGDIVFIESRETEVFYTGGLLGGGQYTLPRDYDLCALEAVSIAEGRQQGGVGGSAMMQSSGGVSALNKDVVTSASRLVILRRLPNRQRITIEVDLHKAMRYPEENIRILPGDMLILEYTFPESVCAFTQRFLLEGALIGIATSMFMTN